MSTEDKLRRALEGAESFIAVMVGHGPNAIIPETINSPIGVPIKIGELMRNVREALAATQEQRGETGREAIRQAGGQP